VVPFRHHILISSSALVFVLIKAIYVIDFEFCLPNGERKSTDFSLFTTPKAEKNFQNSLVIEKKSIHNVLIHSDESLVVLLQTRRILKELKNFKWMYMK